MPQPVPVQWGQRTFAGLRRFAWLISRILQQATHSPHWRSDAGAAASAVITSLCGPRVCSAPFRAALRPGSAVSSLEHAVALLVDDLLGLGDGEGAGVFLARVRFRADDLVLLHAVGR